MRCLPLLLSKAPMKKGHHMGDYIPPEELEKFLASCKDAAAQMAAKEAAEKAKIISVFSLIYLDSFMTCRAIHVKHTTNHHLHKGKFYVFCNIVLEIWRIENLGQECFDL